MWHGSTTSPSFRHLFPPPVFFSPFRFLLASGHLFLPNESVRVEMLRPHFLSCLGKEVWRPKVPEYISLVSSHTLLVLSWEEHSVFKVESARWSPLHIHFTNSILRELFFDERNRKKCYFYICNIIFILKYYFQYYLFTCACFFLNTWSPSTKDLSGFYKPK